MYKELKKIFSDYDTKYPWEKDIGLKYLNLLEKYSQDAFFRDNMVGHFTWSMYVFNTDRTKVLLMHHKKLKKWIQFGWHPDWDSDIENVALRELEEESWITCTKKDLLKDFVDLDIHDIPAQATKGEAKHKHYDIRFWVDVDEQIAFIKEEKEVNDIQWFSFEEVEDMENEIWEESLLKVIKKIKKLN